MKNQFDVAIIGGGIVGLASAYKIQRRHPEKKVVVFEKEEVLAAHQTGHNSGVIHSGLYYRPGSYRAKNCVAGRRELVSFAKEHNVTHDVCGKVVVATQEEELPRLDKIFENGLANDTEGIEKINGQQIKDIEPYCEGIAGIWVPCTGIIDFVGVTNKLAQLIKAINPQSEVITGCEVLNFEKDSLNTISTTKGLYQSHYMVFCAGL